MIGKNIHELRKERGLTLTELSDRANIAKSYLSNIERNINQNPSIQVVEKIARVLDVEFTQLLTNESGKEAEPLEPEWIELIKELKALGVKKEQLYEYKTLLEFIKWKCQED